MEKHCDICGLPLESSFIGNGDGDGDGDRFAHPECYYRQEMDRYKTAYEKLQMEKFSEEHGTREKTVAESIDEIILHIDDQNYGKARSAANTLLKRLPKLLIREKA